MKVIAERLWNEPAYFAAAVVAVCELTLQFVSLPNVVERPLSVLVVLAGGHVVRQNVRPIKKTPRR